MSHQQNGCVQKNENDISTAKQGFGLAAGMGVRRGGQEGALDPPWLAKIVCFLTF